MLRRLLLSKCHVVDGAFTWPQESSASIAKMLELSSFDFGRFGQVLKEINTNFQHSMVLAATKHELSFSTHKQNIWKKQRLPPLTEISVTSFSWAKILEESHSLDYSAAQMQHQLIASSFCLEGGKVLLNLYRSFPGEGFVDTARKQLSVEDFISDQRIYSRKKIEVLCVWRDRVAQQTKTTASKWLDESHNANQLILRKITRFVRMVDLRIAQLVRDLLSESCKQWLHVFCLPKRETDLLEPDCFDEHSIDMLAPLSHDKIFMHEMIVDKAQARLKNTLDLKPLQEKVQTHFRHMVQECVRTCSKVLNPDLTNEWRARLHRPLNPNTIPPRLFFPSQSNEDEFGRKGLSLSLSLFRVPNFTALPPSKLMLYLSPFILVLVYGDVYIDGSVDACSVLYIDYGEIEQRKTHISSSMAQSLADNPRHSEMKLELERSSSSSIKLLTSNWCAQSLTERMSSTELAVSLRINDDDDEQSNLMSNFDPFSNLLSVDIDEELKTLGNAPGNTFIMWETHVGLL
jgi:hypothetical protein